ncbi:CASTOR/POLLUX-related putative ion channel [Marinobacter xestospongiae]|uniref:Ion channel DMI1 n=1 Tax=Marinobacter xestospongiae TaxID=994319 RepID=A0ABU3VW29_9GAMM|nr:ion channel DMI1 [Marinobacter xestospongiae]MDV2078461.1 ion channel DMI1 [Marinobacter xestospongiae]
MLPLRFIDRVKFFVERQFVRGAAFQLLVVALVIGLISLVGGLLVAPLGEPFDGLADAIWWAFLRLTDPGYLGDDSGSWQRFVSTLLTISGYVVFLGALVAILTRWLITLMNDLERGLTPVSLKNHVVVLGWTPLTLPLLSELLGASRRVRRFLERHDARRLNLVVLSEEASAAQVLELRSEPGIGGKARQVILRAGQPIQPDALHRVACLEAAAVIIPSAVHPSSSLVSADVETVKALLSITAQARQSGQALPFVVAEVQDLRKRPVIERAYPGPVEVVAGDATISRLLAQNVFHPGLSAIYNELLTSGVGNELYIRSDDGLVGMTLENLACQRPRALVLGLLRKGDDGQWQVLLAVATTTEIVAGDRIVMMARSYEDTEPDGRQSPLKPVPRTPAVAPVAVAARQRRVLVLGWSRKVPALLQELDSYPQQQLQVDVVSVVPEAQRVSAVSAYLGTPRRLRCQHLEADYMVEGELRRLRPDGYDTILLLSSDRLSSGEEADARAMVGYLQLEDILAEAGGRPQLILELSDPDNRDLLGVHQAEMLVSPMVLSHVLAQVALRPELRVVLDELFCAGGAEFQFRDPADYPLPASADFRTLERVLAHQGELAVGVWRWHATGPQLELNPSRSGYLDLGPGDRLVVLAVTHPVGPSTD